MVRAGRVRLTKIDEVRVHSNEPRTRDNLAAIVEGREMISTVWLLPAEIKHIEETGGVWTQVHTERGRATWSFYVKESADEILAAIEAIQ